MTGLVYVDISTIMVGITTAIDVWTHRLYWTWNHYSQRCLGNIYYRWRWNHYNQRCLHDLLPSERLGSSHSTIGCLNSHILVHYSFSMVQWVLEAALHVSKGSPQPMDSSPHPSPTKKVQSTRCIHTETSIYSLYIGYIGRIYGQSLAI